MQRASLSDKTKGAKDVILGGDAGEGESVNMLM